MLIWSHSEPLAIFDREAVHSADIHNRATLCSIIRFVVIVSNRATTSPEFDPTWYGGTSIGLSILEINIATIVAALPVFWPHLRRNIDKIMVTHEVEVKITTSPVFSQTSGDSRWATVPWQAGNNKAGNEVIFMRKLEGINNGGGDDFGAGIPNEGERSYSQASRTHLRADSSHSDGSQGHQVFILKS